MNWQRWVVYPSLAGLRVLKQNWGPIQSLRCGPTCVTISTWDNHLSSLFPPPLGCRVSDLSFPNWTLSIKGLPTLKGGCRSFVAFGGVRFHWPNASTYFRQNKISTYLCQFCRTKRIFIQWKNNWANLKFNWARFTNVVFIVNIRQRLQSIFQQHTMWSHDK